MHKWFPVFLAFFAAHLTSAQNSYEEDKTALADLAKNLSSFNIVVVVNDITVPYSNVVSAELISSFNFLKKMKRKTNDPDLTIHVRLNSYQKEEPGYTVYSRDTYNDKVTYYISGSYFLISSLLVKSRTNEEYPIVFNPDKKYTTGIYYTTYTSYNQISVMPNISLMPNTSRLLVNKNTVDNSVENRLMLFNAGFKANTAVFLNAFKKLLIDYRKSIETPESSSINIPQ